MFRMFSFLPPIASYILAMGVIASTFYLQAGLLEANPDTDVNKVWLIGGIVAFLVAFGGFQKSIENRSEKMQPRVSSADVLQKLTPTETAVADPSFDVSPSPMQTLDANSPLGRVRARSNPVETL